MLFFSRPLQRAIVLSALPRRITPYRFYSKSVDRGGVELPPLREWKSSFPYSKQSNHRVSISNIDTARKVAEAFVPEGSKDKIIIEAFPGPGRLTRALLELPRERIKKLIVCEDVKVYLPYLLPLQAVHDRLVVIPKSALLWTTYEEMQENGLLDDVETHPWETLHPQLQWIAQVPLTVYGEQLISQLLRFIPGRQWLFKYGRMPLHVVLGQFLLQRLNAEPGHPTARSKLSINRELTATVRGALPFEDTQPYIDHFHPPGLDKPLTGGKSLGKPFQTAIIEPLVDAAPGGDFLEKCDYCLRQMFIHKSQPVSKAITNLGSGSDGDFMTSRLFDPSLPPEARIDPSTLVRSLTLHEWLLIVKVFDEWPFAPTDLCLRSLSSQEARGSNQRR